MYVTNIITKSCAIKALSIGVLAIFSTMTIAGDPVPNNSSTGETVSASEMNENFESLVDRAWDLSGADLSYSGGKVGIGTDAPLNRLSVVDATGDATLEIRGGEEGNTNGKAILLLRGQNSDGVWANWGKIQVEPRKITWIT